MKSFSRAAQELYLSQPTVSSHIANLEEELGISLFDRIGRDILPTQAGKLLYENANQLIRLREQVYIQLSTLKGEVAGELNVGGSTIPGNYILPEIISEFKSLYSKVSLNFKISDSTSIIEEILNGSLDVALVGAKSEHPDLSFDPIVHDELIVLGRSSALSRIGQDIDLFAFKKLPWLIREKGSGTRIAMEKGLLSLGLRLKDLDVAATVFGTEAVLRCVRAGLGVSITSCLAAADLIAQDGILWIQIPDLNLKRDFYLVYRKHREVFPAASGFIKLLQDKKHGLSKGIEELKSKYTQNNIILKLT